MLEVAPNIVRRINFGEFCNGSFFVNIQNGYLFWLFYSTFHAVVQRGRDSALLISPSNKIYELRIFRQLNTMHVSQELIEWQIESDKESRGL